MHVCDLKSPEWISTRKGKIYSLSLVLILPLCEWRNGSSAQALCLPAPWLLRLALWSSTLFSLMWTNWCAMCSWWISCLSLTAPSSVATVYGYTCQVVNSPYGHSLVLVVSHENASPTFLTDNCLLKNLHAVSFLKTYFILWCTYCNVLLHTWRLAPRNRNYTRYK
jgi:hypothetical protein